MITSVEETRTMAEKDPGAQLRAVDRWVSRRQRSIEFLRQNGIGGLIVKIREAGISGTAGFVRRQVRHQACSFLGSRWDRKYGVDTSGQIDLVNVDVVGPNKDNGYASVSTSPSAYAFLSAYFPGDWKEFTFVDVGCGKGRVLMLAALQGFETIIGIEFAPLICQIAEQNLASFSGRPPRDWSIVNADATTVELPSDAPLLVYCFNPFKAEIWKRFIPVLLKANEAQGNPMCLIVSGTIPDELRAAAAEIESSSRFRTRAHGVTPFFVDAYAPYHYWVFDAI
jgi:predicted RNA methylase